MTVYKIRRKLDGLYWNDNSFNESGNIYKQKCNAEYLIQKNELLSGCTVEEFILVPVFNGITSVRLAEEKNITPNCGECYMHETYRNVYGNIEHLCSGQGYRNCVTAYNTENCQRLYGLYET